MGFIVTNLSLPSRAVVRFYNKRGTAEQWIKESKEAVKMTRLVSSIPGQRSALAVKRAGLQSGQSVAAHVDAEENRPLVADEPAATVGETCPVLLAPVS